MSKPSGTMWGYAVFVAAIAIAMVCSNHLILPEQFQIAPVWPPIGIAFAGVLYWGPKVWPLIGLGHIIGQIASGPIPPEFFTMNVVANVSAPLLGRTAILRIWNRLPAHSNLRTGMQLLVGAVVVSVVSACLGTMGAEVSGFASNQNALTIWAQWFLGDMFGLIVATPATLSVAIAVASPERITCDEGFHRHLEKVFWLVAVGAASMLWFWMAEASPSFALAIAFLPMAFMIWSAVRFDHLFSTLSVFAVTMAVVSLITRGMAGFTAPQTPLDGIIMMLFVSVMGLVPLLVGAAAQQNRHYARQLNYRAYHDSLTRLPNRDAFERAAEAAVVEAAQSDRGGALVYLDLDNFKVVNDTSGHRAGDEVLKQISQVLAERLGPGDLLARLGGDEFGLVLPGRSLSEAEDLARGLIKAVDEFRFVWRSHLFALSSSAGIAAITPKTESYGRVLALADAACFEAKDRGGNRVIVAGGSEDPDTERQTQAMHWALAINDALEHNRFELYCQRIVPIANPAQGAHVEVLLRLRDAHGKLLAPTAFIPAAERFQLITKVDLWVIRSTLAALERYESHLDRLDVCAINLGAASFSDAECLAQIVQAIEESPVPAGKLCFEVTETAAIADLAHAIQFIDRLRDMGCQFALDDFGSGLSSFSYLRSLKAEFVKIDGSFIRDIFDNPVDLAMVRSINDISHELGKLTVAEYVESLAIADRLREIGVDYGQGYAFSKPVPLHDMLTRLLGTPRAATEQLSQAHTS